MEALLLLLLGATAHGGSAAGSKLGTYLQQYRKPLISRADDCSSPTYNSTSGLVFTKSCGHILACQRGTWCEPRQGVASINDCMDVCASTNRICYGVSYFPGSAVCTLQYDSNTVVVASTTADSAIADVSQLTPSGGISCPAPNGTTVSNSDAVFKVYCGKSVGDVGRYCPSNMPCVQHADTFDQCLGYCAAARPLCTAAIWNADMANGFLNCQLKNATSYYNGFYTVLSATHSGQLINQDSEQAKLQDSDKTEYTSSGHDYEIDHNTTRSGITVSSTSHQISVESCIDSCSGSSSCTGTLWSPDLNDGWDNCRLLSNPGTLVDGSSTNTTFAQLKSASNSTSTTATATAAATGTGTPSASPAQGSGSSGDNNQNRTIGLGVGLGVGLFALMSLVLLLLCLGRRRKLRQSRRSYNHGLKSSDHDENHHGSRGESEASNADHDVPAPPTFSRYTPSTTEYAPSVSLHGIASPQNEYAKPPALAPYRFQTPHQEPAASTNQHTSITRESSQAERGQPSLHPPESDPTARVSSVQAEVGTHETESGGSHRTDSTPYATARRDDFSTSLATPKSPYKMWLASDVISSVDESH